MKLLRRSSRRSRPRINDYSYPQLRMPTNTITGTRSSSFVATREPAQAGDREAR